MKGEVAVNVTLVGQRSPQLEGGHARAPRDQASKARLSDSKEDLVHTERDAQIVEWLGRIGAAGAWHVEQQFGMHRVATYRRLGRLTAEGLVHHRMMLHNRPGLYSATREGLRWRSLTRLRVFHAKPATYEHIWEAATAAVLLRRRLPGWRPIYEREIKRLETDEGRLIASIETGKEDFRSRLHRPDLVLVAPSGRVVAVEVELTDKGPYRLRQICRGWAWARHVEHVYYLAEPRAARSLARAAQAVKAEDAITILDLEDVAGLVERELAEEEARSGRGVIAPLPATWLS
jgi:hypothetical protein